MKVSKQEAAILGTFLAVVVVAAGGYIWYTTRPPSGAQLTQTANADLALQEEEIRALDTVSALLDGQRIDAIVRSGVFDGLPVEGSVDVLPTSYTPIPVETKRVVCAGLIMREASPLVANWRATTSLDAWLKANLPELIQKMAAEEIARLTGRR